METEKHSASGHERKPHKNHYRKLLLMVVISFIAMYMLMYAMVDAWANIIPNVNQLYMAGLMTSAMLIIELGIMGHMYPRKKLNATLLLIGILATVGFYSGIRQQSFVGDRQFLKSMIPHHAAAILMVKETALHDPEIKKLGDSIVSAQNREIEFMKAKLKELESK